MTRLAPPAVGVPVETWGGTLLARHFKAARHPLKVLVRDAPDRRDLRVSLVSLNGVEFETVEGTG